VLPNTGEIEQDAGAEAIQRASAEGLGKHAARSTAVGDVASVTDAPRESAAARGGEPSPQNCIPQLG
jgi:hypothetical protein